MSERHEVLRLEVIRVTAGKREILNVERFDVAAGEVVALLGPNGSGKSTLLRTGALLIEPSAGTVRLFDTEPRGRGQRTLLRRRTASVFTDPTLLDMSARANVEVALGIRGVAREARRRQAEAWLERLGVLPLAGARPHTLSAGEAQRVALARAFAVEPELLFLDEPFAALDFDTRARLVGDLRELLSSSQAAAVIATHDRSEAELLADGVAVLLEGRVEQVGSVEDVLEHPCSTAVAGLLGHALMPRDALLSRMPELRAGGAVAHVPPGAIEVVAPGDDASIAVPVLGVRGAGGRIQVVCDLGGPVVIEAGMRDVLARTLRAGDLVHLRFDLERLYWFA